MTTRNRRKREQKPSMRWREFMWIRWRTATAAYHVAKASWWATANNGMPPFSGDYAWGTDAQRHAL